MKRIFIISIIATLFLGVTESALASTELSITPKKVDHASILQRIKYVFQQNLERVFNTKKQLKDIIRDGNVVVKFYRPECRYCKTLEPMINKAKIKFAQDVTFIDVNLNAQTTDYKKTYKFDSVPTIVYFKDGKEFLRHGSNDGQITQQEIEANIARLMNGEKHAKKTSNGKLNEEERACLNLLISLAESHAIQLSEQLHEFFDTDNNKESYKDHISKFYTLLMNIDDAIIAPLRKAIKSSQNPKCKKMLTLLETLVKELHDNLKEVHDLLEKHVGKKSIELAQALGKYKDKAEKNAPRIEATLKELFSTLQSLDQGLAQKIQGIQKSLQSNFEMKQSNLVLLSRLKKRMDYR